MKTLLQNILPFFLILLLLLVVFGLAFALVACLALGLGYLLRWAVPTFSLFEATLLGTLFGVIIVYTLRNIVRTLLPDGRGGAWTDDDEEQETDHETIAQERFFKSNEERTWDAWLRAELANDIYAEFQDAPKGISNLNSIQSQELSIRLAEAGINIIKRKTGRTRRLSINLNDLRRELNRMGQRAYDDDILMMALAAINMNLNFFSDDLREVIRGQKWEELAEIPE